MFIFSEELYFPTYFREPVYLTQSCRFAVELVDVS